MALPQPDTVDPWPDDRSWGHPAVSAGPLPLVPPVPVQLPVQPVERRNHAMRNVARDELAVVAAAFGPGRGRRALDVGGGTGRFSALLERAGWQVTTFEGPAQLLAPLPRPADGWATGTGRTDQPASGAALAFDAGEFDAVVAMRVVKYLLDTEAALAELSRVVTPGGTVVFDLCNGRSIARLGHPAGRVGFITLASIPALLRRVRLAPVSIAPGPRLPHPLYLRAGSPRAARWVDRCERVAERVLPTGAGARSFVVTAVRCR